MRVRPRHTQASWFTLDPAENRITVRSSAEVAENPLADLSTRSTLADRTWVLSRELGLHHMDKGTLRDVVLLVASVSLQFAAYCCVRAFLCGHVV